MKKQFILGMAAFALSFQAFAQDSRLMKIESRLASNSTVNTTQENNQVASEKYLTEMSLSELENTFTTNVNSARGQILSNEAANTILESKNLIIQKVLETKKLAEKASGEKYIVAAFGFYLGGEVPMRLPVIKRIDPALAFSTNILGALTYTEFDPSTQIHSRSWRSSYELGGQLESAFHNPAFIRERFGAQGKVNIKVVLVNANQKRSLESLAGFYTKASLELDLKVAGIDVGHMASIDSSGVVHILNVSLLVGSQERTAQVDTGVMYLGLGNLSDVGSNISNFWGRITGKNNVSNNE